MNSRKVSSRIRDAFYANKAYVGINANCYVRFNQLYVYGDLAVDMDGEEVVIYRDALTKPDGRYGLTAINYVRAFLNLSTEQFGIRDGKLFLSEKLVDIKLV